MTGCHGDCFPETEGTAGDGPARERDGVGSSRGASYGTVLDRAVEPQTSSNAAQPDALSPMTLRIEASSGPSVEQRLRPERPRRRRSPSRARTWSTPATLRRLAIERAIAAASAPPQAEPNPTIPPVAAMPREPSIRVRALSATPVCDATTGRWASDSMVKIVAREQGGSTIIRRPSSSASERPVRPPSVRRRPRLSRVGRFPEPGVVDQIVEAGQIGAQRVSTSTPAASRLSAQRPRVRARTARASDGPVRAIRRRPLAPQVERAGVEAPPRFRRPGRCRVRAVVIAIFAGAAARLGRDAEHLDRHVDEPRDAIRHGHAPAAKLRRRRSAWSKRRCPRGDPSLARTPPGTWRRGRDGSSPAVRATRACAPAGSWRR